MIDIKDRYKRFLEWKLQPHQVSPLSEEAHECPTCGTNYQGNYCPRCGQSARIGRYSLKKALLLFLDVWGMGNRGMFRTLRDLLLRPGYMIRDYPRCAKAPRVHLLRLGRDHGIQTRTLVPGQLCDLLSPAESWGAPGSSRVPSSGAQASFSYPSAFPPLARRVL